MDVNLTKQEAEKNFVNLTKKAAEKVALAGLNGQVAQVVNVMDISGSMRGLFDKGVVQKVTERSLALAVQFDDDGEIPVYPFGRDSHKSIRLTRPDFFGFVEREIRSKFSLEGDTLYGKPLRRIIDDHFPGAITNGAPTKGFFKKMFSGNGGMSETITIKPLGNTSVDPVFVIFVTDGNNNDRQLAEEIIVKAAVLPMFIQFVGIGNSSFDFLKKLDDLNGRFIDNAGFCHIPNIETITDDEFLSEMLNEFPEYVIKARQKGLIS